MFEPKNEMGVVFLFSSMMERAGWEMIQIGASFPDAVIRRAGEAWRVEFEYASINFVTHRHDIRNCDLIICWENNYQDCPLPVIELRNRDWIDRVPVKGNPLLNEIEHWRQKAIKAEKRLELLEREKKAKSDHSGDHCW